MLKWVDWVGYNSCFVEEETLCHIIPSYSFSSIGWTYFDPCTYIQGKLAHMTSYTISNDILNENGGVDLGWLHHWFKLDINYWLIHG